MTANEQLVRLRGIPGLEWASLEWLVAVNEALFMGLEFCDLP